MLKPALLVLTLMADGGTRLTLSEAETAEDCEAMREVVTQILTEAGQPPLLSRCGATALRLTPFVHGVPAEAEIWRYRVELPEGGGFSVTPLDSAAACDPAPQARPAIHCARSAQKVLADG
ncbi:hypothetical protein SAMN04487972_10296 [Paracoccus halophilus]|uniref:Uncharacterized protein n=1 Tax=Paracoccus halophilus TaxID=376733 RepID=A0A099F9E9_9RHOB|nr:hypothetical protein [Paracoccus halophilus]KGJ06843.1 hypothetical protein IT41_01325 [Paracoccus halophilus]SFA41186.1 hypothetical protein SAMN04487972_10296 [Paracoccus halophilus]